MNIIEVCSEELKEDSNDNNDVEEASYIVRILISCLNVYALGQSQIFDSVVFYKKVTVDMLTALIFVL